MPTSPHRPHTEYLQQRAAKYFHNGRYVVSDSGCWIWGGAKKRGYGFIYLREGGIQFGVAAHRVSYSISNGALIDGLVIDHLCNNTMCVNPAHLTQVTQRANVIRAESEPGKNSRKTHCKNGHEYTPENIRSNRLLGRGWRECVICYKAQRKAKRIRLKNKRHELKKNNNDEQQ